MSTRHKLIIGDHAVPDGAAREFNDSLDRHNKERWRLLPDTIVWAHEEKRWVISAVMVREEETRR